MSIKEDQIEIRASRLAEKLLPQVQNGLPRANALRPWLRTLPGEWRANMHSQLGEDAKLPGQTLEFYNVALMQHVEEVSLKLPLFYGTIQAHLYARRICYAAWLLL